MNGNKLEECRCDFGGKILWDKSTELKSTTPFDLELFSSLCPKRSMILDVGCAYGRVCAMLEDAGFMNIWGIDRSKTQLLRALARLKVTKLVRGDACRLPFEHAIFDCVITFGLINCLILTEDIYRFIKEVARVSKQGAYWFVNLYARNRSETFEMKYFDGIQKFGIPYVFETNNGAVFRHYSLGEFLNAAEEQFEVLICQKKEFLSFSQRRTVTGYSMVLQRSRSWPVIT